jgi:hypothetical protein
MFGIAITLAPLSRSLPGMCQPREPTFVERRGTRRSIASVQDARVNEQQRNEGDDGQRQPREACPAQRKNDENGAEKDREPHPGQPRMARLEPLGIPAARGETLSIGRLYGRTLPSAFHRYKVRVVPDVSTNVSTLSGCQSPMLNACETMRAPGLSCLVRIGRSLRFDADSK